MLSNKEVKAWMYLSSQLDLLDEYEEIDCLERSALENQKLMPLEDNYNRLI